MIRKLIDEITIALHEGLYLVALSAALTLPDVCGKAEYPNEKTGKRYKNWCTQYVKNAGLPADTIYALRCSLLHEGSAEAKTENNFSFRLMTNALTQPYGMHFCTQLKTTHADGTSEIKVMVYVGFLCTVICAAAMEYYEQNKNKFDFLNYSIPDLASDFEIR